ncbi:MAG TPA: glycosyltransferase family 1 protein [Pyrinomonadaceae bacterium]|nr:glycosyltransferase family 1 protein [Pyrinomonadaceae bacterium]
MRILYDGAITQEHGAGGIKRYFANLIRRLPSDFEPHFTSCSGLHETEPSHPRLRLHRFRRFRPQRLSLKLEKVFFRRVQDSLPFNLAHPTYYTLLSQDEIRSYRCPVVVTVWDMIHELFPELYPDAEFLARKRRAIESATAVICISENTRRDLLSRYPINEDRVFVTHLASELDPTLIQGNEQTPAGPYFLYVGARAGYKNFDGLLSALAAAIPLAPEIALCTVGAPFSESEQKIIARLGLNGRVENYGRVSDRQLAALYQRSLAFVYPSLYEGFGIPLLEAMQCGAPVIASNRSSIPEVVGDAAILINPEQTSELTDALVAISNRPALRQSLIARGYDHARSFSWEETTRQTLEIYRKFAR